MLIDLDYKQISLSDDEQNPITIELKSVSAADYHLLIKIIKNVFDTQKATDITTDTGKAEMGIAQLENPELVEIAKNLFPKYTRNLKGIQIKREGSVVEATVEDLY